MSSDSGRGGGFPTQLVRRRGSSSLTCFCLHPYHARTAACLRVALPVCLLSLTADVLTVDLT